MQGNERAVFFDNASDQFTITRQDNDDLLTISNEWMIDSSILYVSTSTLWIGENTILFRCSKIWLLPYHHLRAMKKDLYYAQSEERLK